MEERRTLESLARARVALEGLDLERATVDGPWSVAQVLVHCAQSIESAMAGFPRAKPWLFRVTAGKLALATFLRRGYMTHDRRAPIPGAPPPEAIDAGAARARLLRVIGEFQARDALAPHFAYGAVPKPRYDRVQAMHIADHLSSFLLRA